MRNRPLILVTNDDGITSPGLRTMAQAVADLGDLLIVAPCTQQTGAGRSYPNRIDKTIYTTELLLNGQRYPAFKANVSPAQAVSLSVTDLAKRPIDLCLSGINYGENIGSGVTVSGTVGAALEAACYGIPALAVSFETPQEFHLNHSETVDFSVAAHFTRFFAQKTLETGFPPHVDILKIDVPASATPQTPWQIGKISRQRYYQSLPTDHFKEKEVEENADGVKNFYYQIVIDHDTLEPNSDVKIFAVDKQVSVVPMTIDLTAPVLFSDVNHFFNGTQK